MRNIEKPAEKERKRKRNSRIISIFFLSILILSSVGYAFLAYQPGANTNSDIQNNGNQWIIQYQDQTLTFSSSPASTADVEVSMNKDIASYVAKPLYIVSDNEGISYEIASNLGRYAQRTQLACYGDCDESTLPEKTCADNLIVWISSQENKVYQENNCIFIEGDMRAVDAFLYKIFKVV